MNTMKFASALVVVLCLVGCEQEQPKPAEPTKAATPAPVKPVAVAAPKVTPISLDSIPTEEDFEEEAAKEVTLANVGKQLDSLEKEISSE